jgi:ribonuclease Z
MNRIVILGSAYSISSIDLDNSHFAIEAGKRVILVDCASNPVARLQKAKLPLDHLTDVVLTHFHPDHVYGLPLLLMDLWLMKRKSSLTIHGLKTTLDRAKQMMSAFDWEEWPGMFPVEFDVVDGDKLEEIIVGDMLVIKARTVKHLIPTIGLRIDFKDSRKIVAYSCDTEPCPEVLELAKQADILIQESAGKAPGHTSSEQAGTLATNAGVKVLYLIHYPPSMNPMKLIGEARSKFNGLVFLARDFLEIGI